MRNFIGRGNFTWFVGVVEDINDPSKLGRVRVRCYGYHTEDKGQIPTEELPWAIPVNPVTGASTSGVGEMPTGLVQGSWVIGFFIDGDDAQEPAILGSIASAPTTLPDGNIGFNDPDEVFPRYVDESDVNRLARGTQTKTYTPDSAIGEPNDPYKAKYPYNRVMETRSGHVKEYDDTPNAERIREYHKSGTFYQVHPDGTVSTHIIKDRFTVVANDDSIHVKGNVKILVDGNVDFDCSDLNINASTGTITIGTGDVVASGISLVSHTHTDTAGLGAGITSAPNPE
tara:strand:+ start:1395 stop:2249 length:855 start_codon:yes stop_codon:yes gene_type:complete